MAGDDMAVIDQNEIIKGQQLALLYEALPRSLAASTVIALALSYVQLNAINPTQVLIWLSFFSTITILRFFAWLWYLKHKNASLILLDRIALISAIASGATWGGAGILLFPADNAEHQFFLAFALAGMAAGSIAVLSYRLHQAWWFITLSLLPITIQWFTAGNTLSVAEAIMTLAFAAVLYSMASVSNRHSTLALNAEIKAENSARGAAQDRDFLQLILDTIPARVYWKDTDLKYLGGNQLFARDAGFTDIAKLTDKAQQPNSNEASQTSDAEVIKSGSASLHEKERITLANGEVRWRDISRTPMRNTAGEIIGILGTYHDITEKVEVESQLRQAQKMEAMGTLVAGIAHEFNNMLTSIMGNIDLAAELLRDKQIEPSLKLLSYADDASGKAAKMIRQLMTLSRKDQLFIKLVPTNLNQWLEDALSLSKTSIPENITLNVACDDTPMSTNADSSLLLQILVNLINNACDAVANQTSPEISISLSTEVLDPEFQRKHDLSGREYIKLCISDNGIGIPDQQLEQIFEPFFTTKEVGKGTGLGLSIVQGAMQSHHGCIEVASTPELGTTFSLYFPRTNTPLTQPVIQQSKHFDPGLKGHGETILVADDDPEVLRFISAQLQQQGYQTLAAKDGKHALTLFEQQQDSIRAVLLDVMMPHMLGSTAAKHIRAIKADIPLAFCSAYSQEDIQNEISFISNFELIMKPFKIDELNRIVHKLVNSNL